MGLPQEEFPFVRLRLPLSLGALLVVLTAGAGLLRAPGLLGSPGGEVFGHAWVQGWHAAALPRWPEGTVLAEGTTHWPVIDPLPTLIAASVGRVAGPVIGYDLWILLAFALAFAGGAWLARREGGDPWVGGLALALAPALAGSLTSGLTEDGALGLAAIGLGLVGAGGWRAGLALGLLAACGLVLAWQAALVAVAFGIALLLTRGLSQIRQLVPAALLAAGIALPVAALQGGRLGGVGHHSGQVAAMAEPLWRLNPWRGIDLLSLVAPGRQDPGEALVRMHPGYLGLTLLGLACFAGRSRWWAVLLVGIPLSLGPTLSFGGVPLEIANPFARLLKILPFGSLVNHHGRLLLIVAVALSVLAARGAVRLRERFGKIPLWIPAVLVAADLIALSPNRWPLPVASAAPSEIATRLGSLPDGALLVVPAGGPGINFQRPLLEQRVHGRKLLLSPNRPGLPARVTATPAGAWLAGLAFPVPPPPPTNLSLPRQVSVLMVMEPYVARVSAAMGPPQVRASDGAAWDLRIRAPADGG